MAKNIIVDTGFWYAFYDKRDGHHEEASVLIDEIDVHNMIVPWPSLYETLNTRFVRRSEWLDSFERYLKKKNIHIVSDEKYRDSAFDNLWILDRTKNNSYSLVDIVIRHMIEDENLKINALFANRHYGPLFCFWDELDSHLSLSEVGHFVMSLRRSYEAGGQILVTSHNPEAIRKFSDENTFVIDRKNHLEPTLVRLLSDMSVKGDLVELLISGDMEL